MPSTGWCAAAILSRPRLSSSQTSRSFYTSSTPPFLTKASEDGVSPSSPTALSMLQTSCPLPPRHAPPRSFSDRNPFAARSWRRDG
ncbi:hypothetical protein J6590_086664 [Homalodisca vitripennis]|nr:hypothetical protein J6590_086664 [Homalodisca vitripennis]